MASPTRRARLAAWPAPKLNLVVMGAAYLIFGLSLMFQPHRWASTPAYHVLLEIFTARTWGVLFIVSGAALALAAWQLAFRRWVVAAFTLTTGWMLSFVARYLTNPSTTPETWVSWAIFDYLLIKVAISLDHPAPAVAVTGGEDLAGQAIDKARSALLLAEEAYARATGEPAHSREPE
jgi:hypothetical protein